MGEERRGGLREELLRKGKLKGARVLERNVCEAIIVIIFDRSSVFICTIAGKSYLQRRLPTSRDHCLRIFPSQIARVFLRFFLRFVFMDVRERSSGL